MDDILAWVDGGDSATTTAIVTTLQTFARNAVNHPQEQKYRRINLSNAGFNRRLWQHESVRTFFAAWGWEEIDGFLVLAPDVDSTVALATISRRLLKLRPSGAATSINYAAPDPNKLRKQRAEDEKRARIKHEQAKIKAQMREEKEQKAALVARVDANRRESAARRVTTSQRQGPRFGSNTATFSDIGVDLNAGGG